MELLQDKLVVRALFYRLQLYQYLVLNPVVKAIGRFQKRFSNWQNLRFPSDASPFGLGLESASQYGFHWSIEISNCGDWHR